MRKGAYHTIPQFSPETSCTDSMLLSGNFCYDVAQMTKKKKDNNKTE